MNYYIAHHGIKGQKWGVRRFQNEDGTLTPAGKRRYGAGVDFIANQVAKSSSPENPVAPYMSAQYYFQTVAGRGIKRFNKDSQEYKDLQKAYRDHKKTNNKAEKETIKFFKKNGMDIVKIGNQMKSGKIDDVTRVKLWREYMKKGVPFIKEYSDKHPEFLKNKNTYLEASKKYEAKVNKFLDSLDYDSLKLPMKNSFNVSYDMETKSIRPQTAKEVISIEMLRRANGKI